MHFIGFINFAYIAFIAVLLSFGLHSCLHGVPREQEWRQTKKRQFRQGGSLKYIFTNITAYPFKFKKFSKKTLFYIKQRLKVIGFGIFIGRQKLCSHAVDKTALQPNGLQSIKEWVFMHLAS